MSSNKKAALVTGGAIRLGKAIASALAGEGYDILIHYNSSAGAAEETAKEIRALGVKCESISYNLLDSENISSLIQKGVELFPHLSVLVNSASGYTQARILETSTEIFDKQFSLNIKAPFFLAKAFKEIVNKGSIINIIDNKSGFNQYQYAAYLLGKKSLLEFTKMAAIEFAPEVRVNAVSPGVVLPAKTRSEEYVNWRVQAIPLKKQGSPEDIGSAVVFMAENEFITGQHITIDGGENIAQIGLNAGEFDQTKI